MNPFAHVESFDVIRGAALAGDEAVSRAQRRLEWQGRGGARREAPLQLDARTLRMARLAVAANKAVLLVGPPGTGKTQLLQQLLREFGEDPTRYGFERDDINGSWVTPEEEWSFGNLVLGETVEQGEVVSTEGLLLQAIRHDEWLVLDEANRADLDRILGGVLTWLSNQPTRIGDWRGVDAEGNPEPPKRVFLKWGAEPGSDVKIEGDSIEYLAGQDWRIIGTYNASDAHRVFRMGKALSRRFKHVPVPPATAEDFDAIVRRHIQREDLADVLADCVTRVYRAHLGDGATALGPGMFIDMPRYVERGLALLEGGDADDEAPPGDGGGDGEGDPPEEGAVPEAQADDELSQLLAESYVIGVGNFIAKYEESEMETLSLNMMRNEAFTLSMWEWIVSSLGSLRA